MLETFEDAMARLRDDSGIESFTAYIADANIQPSLRLVGRVWQHVRVTPEGQFSDGQRIVTAVISLIRVSGDSIWIETETGGVYGIISFAPLGWTHIGSLYKAHQALEPGRPLKPDFIVDRLHDIDYSKLFRPKKVTKASPRVPTSVDGHVGRPRRPQIDPQYPEKLASDIRAMVAQIATNTANWSQANSDSVKPLNFDRPRDQVQPDDTSELTKE
ncbi:hypothetical protein ACI2KS_23080 [Pseudomonas sp. NPDC087358]|uniref:hypothetical protein n=1 Tax=Pseudomonas sp. NPDC087358 TaxID=3364439 RepID=UPI00384E18B8